jgi:hypothetical protein
MARYIERLVARAAVPHDTSAVTPRPLPLYDLAAGDPFENTAEWVPEAPSPAAPAPLKGRPEAPVELSPLHAPARQIIDARTTEFRVEEHWFEKPAEPAIQAAPMPAEAPASIRQEIVHEKEVRIEPRTLEREFHAESVRAETVLQRETVRVEPTPPRAPAEPLTPGTDGLERNILGKLMPALDAWFLSRTPEAHPPEPVAAPLVAPPQRAVETQPPAAVDTPQVVIGSIRVEVVPPAASAPPPARRNRVTRHGPQPPRQAPSKAAFGLGQM